MKTIKSTECTAIDWNEKQLVEVINSGSVVLTSGHHKDDTFEGTFVHTAPSSGRGVGEVDTCLSKEIFVKFKGQITLQND